MTHPRCERRVVTTRPTDTIADGVAARHPHAAVLRDLVPVADDALLVRESSIVTGMRLLLDLAGLVVEPSAALGIAALLENRERFAGRHVAIVLCGSNVDPDACRRWIGAAAYPASGRDRPPRGRRGGPGSGFAAGNPGSLQNEGSFTRCSRSAGADTARRRA